ncbi:MAG: hypothetical protein QOF70_7993 [Acetobacteraceae bacterium]|jgi:hypothetical protein|nr:hypothetical protein [Acetobacteraceae bacterium]
MALTRRPKPPAPAATSAVDVDALINKGGSVARVAEPAPSKPAPVVLRMPPDVLVRIDQAVEARRVKVPRHTWLMEAVIEKLEREAKAPS